MRVLVLLLSLLLPGAVASGYRQEPYRGRIALVNRQYIEGVVRLVGPSCDVTVSIPGGRRVLVKGLEPGSYTAYADFNADGEFSGAVEFLLVKRNKVFLNP